jgi:hypothetical protein
MKVNMEWELSDVDTRDRSSRRRRRGLFLQTDIGGGASDGDSQVVRL